MTHSHHDNIIHPCFTALKMLCALLVHTSLFPASAIADFFKVSLWLYLFQHVAELESDSEVAFFQLVLYLQGSSTSLHGLMAHFVSSLSHIPLLGIATVYAFTCPSEEYLGLCECTFSTPLGKECDC